jgi:hypothetical protein
MRGFSITDDKHIATNIVAQENQCKSVYPLKEKPTSAKADARHVATPPP